MLVDNYHHRLKDKMKFENIFNVKRELSQIAHTNSHFKKNETSSNANYGFISFFRENSGKNLRNEQPVRCDSQHITIDHRNASN